MFAKERQEDIVGKVNLHGSVKVKDLALEYQVTEDCIRKDLSLLENQGLLKKAYGGAVSIRNNPHLYSSSDRKKTSNKERMIIAQKAIQLIKDNETIYLDTSLSSLEIALLLNETHKKITVITNMIDVLNTLRTNQNIKLIFIGGTINSENDAFWDSLSCMMLDYFRIDKAFLGVVGVNTTNGQISTYYVDDGFMKKKAITQSRKSYLMCESRKFKEDGEFIFGSLNDIDGLIVSESMNGLDDFDIDII
ncbi:MAG: DeoR/GlpR family DNA-binding transcription regulator [Erysipelotrichaceae bacterium]|nr:DeoR/GlpR family DNA-binding transcription regulator [Erysipelotrichaceae bacterium]